MVDLVKSFKKNEKKITDYVVNRKSSYYSSNCYKKLKARVGKLQDSIDLRFNTGRNQNNVNNQWLSKIAFPLVRERYLLRKAITKHNFRADPLISITPINNTAIDNARNMQDILNLNLRHTHYRSQAFSRIIRSCSKFGTGVSYSYFNPIERTFKKTVQTQFGYERVTQSVRKRNISHQQVNILNFFQNESIPHTENSDFHGHLERVFLDSLVAEAKAADPSIYIKDNFKSVIAGAKKSALEDTDYTNLAEEGDFHAFTVDKVHFWGKLNIANNEDSDIIYYVVVVDDKIIRFQENPYDENVVPYSIFNFDPRDEFWWGNVDSESVIPHENWMNLVGNASADNAIRSMQQYIFYDRSILDTADLNNRAKNGGWIPTDLKNKKINEILYEFQRRDITPGNIDYMMREVKESAQRMTPAPDLQRGQQQGGIANTTATAALILDQQGDVLEADMLEEFSYGLIRQSEIDVVLLQQFLSDQVGVRPDANLGQRIVEKADFLGTFNFKVESSLSKNKIVEATRLQNVLTQLINYQNTSQNPVFQNIDMLKVARNWMRHLDIGDVDDILPEAPPQIPQQQQIAGPQPSQGGNPPGNSIPFPQGGPQPAAIPQTNLELGAA